MKQQELDQALTYIRSWLPYVFERDDTPGATVAIAHKGQLVFSEAYGYANLEKKERMTTDHIFRIASHSKTFTATAIMQLQEKGKLRIDDHLVEYLPWLEYHTDKRWQHVTIRQLLSHNAGVIRDGSQADYWALEREFPDEEMFKREILDAELVYDTNVRQKYSNYGYALLGMVIAGVSGSSYIDFVTENIIKKLALSHTTAELVDESAQKLVTGYTLKDPDAHLPIAHKVTNGMVAATGFCSTAEDLCAYFTAHHVGSGQLLNDESKKEMQRVQSITRKPGGRYTEYGLGLDIDYLDDMRLVGHSGGMPGHITHTYFSPKNELVVSVLTNSLGGSSWQINRGILSIIKKFKGSASAKPKHDLAKFEGKYKSLWSTVDIVVVGNMIYANNAAQWRPFEGAEELEYVDESTLIVKQADMGSSPGEKIIYNKDGSINYAGIRMIPEAQYRKEFKNKTQIG